MPDPKRPVTITKIKKGTLISDRVEHSGYTPEKTPSDGILVSQYGTPTFIPREELKAFLKSNRQTIQL